MKKFMCIFSIIMVFVLFSVNYSTYSNERYRSLIMASEVYSYQMTIPDDLINANPGYLETLKETAREHNINIIRTISYYDNEKQESVTEEYVYLTTNTRFFRRISIAEGKILSPTDMDNISLFVSTINTKQDNQVGLISDFGGGHNYSIHILDNITTRYKYSGIYRLECPSQEVYNSFIKDYAAKVNLMSGGEFTESEYTNIALVNHPDIGSDFNLATVSLFFLFIMTFTFIFYLVSQTKAISVMKLNGYTTVEICRDIFIFYFIRVFAISNILIVPVMFLIKDNNIDFILQVFLTNILLFLIILLVLTFFCAVYSKYIKTTYCIKGKKPIGAIVIINGIFKIVVSVTIIIFVTSLLGNITAINQKRSSYNNWLVGSNYGVFYPVRTGNDSAAVRAGEYPLDLPTYFLYPYLNSDFNAIYINSDIYSPESLETSSEGSIRYITVNPNFLKEFPLYDEEGKQILIDEEIDYTIYLVPEQYKNMEEYNHQYFSDVRRQFYELHSNFYQQDDKQNSQNVLFIYTQANQRVFSMNSNVFPNNFNMINDPIIHVMTENNCLVPDTFYTSSSNQTLFIRLNNADTAATYAELLPTLREYELDDNFPYLVRLNDFILMEINNLQEEAGVIRIILCGLLVLLLVTIFQNIYLLFQRNRFEFFLKKTMGHSFIVKYKDIFKLHILINLGEFIVCWIIVRNGLAIIFVSKLLIELLLEVLLIVFFERYSTSRILKEGV